jgi:hypothetical protein
LATCSAIVSASKSFAYSVSICFIASTPTVASTTADFGFSLDDTEEKLVPEEESQDKNEQREDEKTLLGNLKEIVEKDQEEDEQTGKEDEQVEGSQAAVMAVNNIVGQMKQMDTEYAKDLDALTIAEQVANLPEWVMNKIKNLKDFVLAIHTLVIEHMTKTVSKLSRKASNLHKRAGL